MTLRLYSEPVDVVVINGLESPGLCRIEQQPTITNMFEDRGGRAISGRTKMYVGRELAKFSLQFDLFDDADLIGYLAWIESLRYRAGVSKKEVVGYPIIHPIVNAWQITRVTLLDDTAPKQSDQNLWTAFAKFEEWREPVVVVEKVTTKGGPPATGGPPISTNFFSKEQQDMLSAADTDLRNAVSDAELSDAEVRRRQRQLDGVSDAAGNVQGVRGL